MEILKKTKNVGDDYYIMHLTIINPFLPKQLTIKEIEVLASFMEIQGDLVADDRFNTLVRKKVREKLKLSPAGLSNYLKTMLSKGLLKKNEFSGRITIMPHLVPAEKGQGYQFKIIQKND